MELNAMSEALQRHIQVHSVGMPPVDFGASYNGEPVLLGTAAACVRSGHLLASLMAWNAAALDRIHMDADAQPVCLGSSADIRSAYAEM